MPTTPQRILIRLAAVAAALGMAGALTACDPGADPAAPTPTAAPSAAPSPAEEEPVADDAPADEGPAADRLTDPQRIDLAEGFMARMPEVVLPYLADPVEFIIASSECCEPLSPETAVAEALDYTQHANNWTSVDAAVLDNIRASVYYGRYMTDDVIAIEGDDGTVVIFVLEGPRVRGILLGDLELLQW